MTPALKELHSLTLRQLERDLPDEAIAMLRRGAKEMPDKLSILANLSWNLSTCPRDDLRDGAYALQLAETCLEKTRFRDPQAFDVLAAALAELGLAGQHPPGDVLAAQDTGAQFVGDVLIPDRSHPLPHSVTAARTPRKANRCSTTEHPRSPPIAARRSARASP